MSNKILGIYYKHLADAQETAEEMSKSEKHLFVVIKCSQGYMVVSEEVAKKNGLVV